MSDRLSYVSSPRLLYIISYFVCRSLQLTERSPNKFAVQQKPPQLQQQASPNRRKHRSPIDYGDYDSSVGEDPYYKSRSFDEDFSSTHKKTPRTEITGQTSMAKRSFSTDKSLNYGRRLYEHNLVCNDQKMHQGSLGGGQNNTNSYRNRSPLIMHYRSGRRSPVSGDEPEELDENEKFYHLKKLLSNANLQNNKNYNQYTKSKSAKRNPHQLSEGLVVADSTQFANTTTTTSISNAMRNRSPMLSKRTESLQAPPQSLGVLKGRPVKLDGRRAGTVGSVSANSGSPQVSSGRY